jgi:poly(3-hydroxybutyrate) depolymerase
MSSTSFPPRAAPLPGLQADLTQCSVSGLSSGAFMAVQLHLAHSSMFVGAGVVAGGPYRCAESFRAGAVLAGDAYVQGALFICMNPLIPQAGPDPERLLTAARATAQRGDIDPLEHVKDHRLYIFTGTKDQVVQSSVVRTTEQFYRRLGVTEANLAFVGDQPAGHALITTNLEDNVLAANCPPYLNQWPEGAPSEMQSWTILRHLHRKLQAPADRLSGRLVRFDQTEFFGDEGTCCFSPYGYAYVPKAVEEGKVKPRVHVALHGCKQGYNYVDLTYGRPDRASDPPYGNRYMTTTGYNEMADTNGIVVLYPQVEGLDDGRIQNPEGCWDWWGYSAPDYYSQKAPQIRTLHRMLQRLGQ